MIAVYVGAVYVGILFILTLLAVSYTTAKLYLPNDTPLKQEVLLRIRTWCWIVAFLIPIFLLSSPYPYILLGLLSFLAFKEFITLSPSRAEDRWAFLWAYIAIPLQYFWAAIGWYGMFIIFIPVYLFLLIPTRLVLSGHPKGFLRSTATLHWGLMTTVFSLSHMAFLLALPPQDNHGWSVNGASLVFFLIFLTQINDIAQFIWGKRFGKRKILPLVSPKKTWAGFLGGVATTVVLCLILAPLFTPLYGWREPSFISFGQIILIGLVVGVFGFIGDVVMSAIKRDIGVKDTGTMLPGHGGLLDRLDSLTFTAPLFFHLIYYFCY